MRVVFFGTPAFAVPSLRALIASPHQVVGVVTQPDRPRGRGQKLSPPPVKVLALEHGIPVLQPVKVRDEAFLGAVRRWQADVGVVAAYGRILPEVLLAVPRLGMVNVHASLLPSFRGAAPVHRAVIAGHAKTGVTIMQVVKELDAGNMLASTDVAIGPDTTSDELETTLSEVGATLLLQVLDDLVRCLTSGVPQDEARATYAPRLEKHEGEINWALSSARIHNLVRGLTPWPLAFTFVDGGRLVVRRTVPAGGSAHGAAPGTVLECTPKGIVVACGEETSLTLVDVQPEGRRTMSAGDYLAGHPVRPGQRLGRQPA